MPTITLSPKLTFNLITGQINVEDLTSYAEYGIDNTFTIRGFIQIYASNGADTLLIYNNIGGTTPDITPPSSLVNANPILIPYDSVTGNILPWTYTLQYDVTATDGSTTFTGSFLQSFEYLIDKPVICLKTSVNCAASTATSKDITDYLQPNATLQSSARQHTLYPPPASRQTPLTANLDTIIYTPIYTTAWQAECITDLTYLQDNGLYVVMRVSGVKDFQVVCDSNLSKVLCCLFQLDKTYQQYLNEGQLTYAENYRNRVIKPTWSKLLLFLAATSAGNATKAATAYDEMIAVSGCSTDCGCSGEISIVPIDNSGTNGSGMVYSVDSPNGTIAVTQQQNGNVVVFHLELSNALQQAIANAVAVQVTAGTVPAYLTVTPSGTNPRIYTINWVGPPVPDDELLNIKCSVSYSNLGIGQPYFDLNTVVINQIGTKWNNTTGFTATFGGAPNRSNDIAVLRIQNFFSNQIPSAPNYIAWANIIKVDDAVAPVITSAKYVEAEVLHADYSNATGNLYVRLFNPSTGDPYILSDLYSLLGSNTLIFQVTINAAP